MRAEPARIHRTATRIAEVANDLWDDVDSLRREVDVLMGSSWSGHAAHTHASLWAEWFDSAQRIAGALTDDAAVLHDVAREYSVEENATTNDIIAGSSRLNL